ncbi:RNA polymerase sigma factor [Pedobacter frigidisoli]|uniref:RNA polymerase sigma factor n=1 Tax=Pedobacter frigidisoli TaxID=2530455 RepID=UPI002930163D|nr:RNA polymerase sigma factor [Pedobacter frigidisoli]
MNDDEFTEMIEEHRGMLNSFALKFTGDIDDANDLIQDTMVKALRFSGKFVQGTNIKGWLYTIMRNTFINDYRKNMKKVALITQEEEISSVNLLPSSTENQSGSAFAMRDIQFAL